LGRSIIGGIFVNEKEAIEKATADAFRIYKNLVFELAVVYSHFYPIFTC